MKTNNRKKLSPNELMFLVFSGEFSILFACIVYHLLPLYACMSIGGFCLSLWYYRDQKNENITKRH